MCSNIQAMPEDELIVDLITTNKDKKFAPVGRMATTIIAIIQERGACLPQDLNNRGFAPDEVAQHWHMAHSLAVVEMKLMNSRPDDLTSFSGSK